MGSGQPFEIRIDAEGVAWLCGELDMASADSLVDEVSMRLGGNPAAVLDMSELTFLDSSGIRAIVELATKSQRVPVIRQPPDNVRKVLAIAGIDGSMGVRIDPPRRWRP